MDEQETRTTGVALLLLGILLFLLGSVVECRGYQVEQPKREYMIALWVATALDITTTEIAINHGAVEKNPIPWMRESKTRIPFILGTSAMVHYLYHKTGNRWVILIPTTVHLTTGSWNLQYAVRW